MRCLYRILEFQIIPMPLGYFTPTNDATYSECLQFVSSLQKQEKLRPRHSTPHPHPQPQSGKHLGSIPAESLSQSKRLKKVRLSLNHSTKAAAIPGQRADPQRPDVGGEPHGNQPLRARPRACSRPPQPQGPRSAGPASDACNP